MPLAGVLPRLRPGRAGAPSQVKHRAPRLTWPRAYPIRQVSCAVVAMPRRGGVAQLVRAPACHAGGRGFKSRLSRQKINGVTNPSKSSLRRKVGIVPTLYAIFFASHFDFRAFRRAASAWRTAAKSTGAYVFCKFADDAKSLASLLPISSALAPPRSPSTAPERRKSASVRVSPGPKTIMRTSLKSSPSVSLE